MNNPDISHFDETILLVDDSLDNLRLLSTMLSSQGYQVKKAINGEFALQSLEVINLYLFLLYINLLVIIGYVVFK